MLCRNCGAQLPEQAKFCSKCGMRTEPSRQAGPGTAQKTESGRSFKAWFGAGNIVGIIATVLMLLVMAVPFVSADYIIGSESFTLFEALDLTELLADREGLKALFIILFVGFILLFIIFKFVGRNRVLSTIGCLGSWALFAVCVIKNFRRGNPQPWLWEERLSDNVSCLKPPLREIVSCWFHKCQLFIADAAVVYFRSVQ